LETAPERLSKVRASSKTILTKLDSILNTTHEQDIAVRLQRLRAYVEYSLLHTEAMASRKSIDLKRLANYSKEHPEQDMVLMYPDYITWRNNN
jgi:flagellin-specific chaperone FliS